jgi:protein-disulfide isomerase-like protein with CxxC motif
MTNALTRQDIDCKRQAPLIKVVHDLLVQAGMERSKAFDTADTIVRTLEPHIASGLFAVVHNSMLDVVNAVSRASYGGLRPKQEEMLRGLLESVELQQRVFSDAMNAEQAANLKAKR